MAYIFLDESGQFTKVKNGDYFIVGSFIIGDPRRTEKRFRGWYKTRFPRKLRNKCEIKFSEVKIDDNLRLKTLKYISSLDVRIRFAYLKRENIPDEYRVKNSIKSGHLYTQIIGEILEMYTPTTDLDFRVFCDQRHLKGITRAQFKEMLRTRLLPLLPKGAILQIEMIDSTTNANIQIADWITGALAKYLEKQKWGEEYYSILKNNIIGEGKELFKDYWVEAKTNKKLESK